MTHLYFWVNEYCWFREICCVMTHFVFSPKNDFPNFSCVLDEASIWLETVSSRTIFGVNLSLFYWHLFFSLFWLSTVARRFPFVFVNLVIFNLFNFFYLFNLWWSQVYLRFFRQCGFLFTTWIIGFLVFEPAVVARRIPFVFVKLMCFRVLFLCFVFVFCSCFGRFFDLRRLQVSQKFATKVYSRRGVYWNRYYSGPLQWARSNYALKRSVTARPPARGVWVIRLGPVFSFWVGYQNKNFVSCMRCS